MAETGGWRRLRDDDSGASAVEFAILALPFLLTIFLLIQAGLWFYGRQVALDAAREGVSQLRLSQSADDCESLVGGVEVHVQDFAHNVGSGALIDPVMLAPDCNNQRVVSVTVTGHAVSLVPGLTLSVSEVATGQFERFQSQP